MASSRPSLAINRGQHLVQSMNQPASSQEQPQCPARRAHNHISLWNITLTIIGCPPVFETECDRADAVGALCLIFTSKFAREEIPIRYFSQFYVALQNALRIDYVPDSASEGTSSVTTSEGQVSSAGHAPFPIAISPHLMAAVMCNSVQIFQMDLYGSSLMIPHFLPALELILQRGSKFSPPAHIPLSSVRCSAIEILISLLCYPLHFGQLAIHGHVSPAFAIDGDSLTNYEWDVSAGMHRVASLSTQKEPLTFFSLRSRLLNLLLNSIQTEKNPGDIHLLLAGLCVAITDSVEYDARRQDEEFNRDHLPHSASQPANSPSAWSVDLIRRSIHSICHMITSPAHWLNDNQSSLAAIETLELCARIQIPWSSSRRGTMTNTGNTLSMESGLSVGTNNSYAVSTHPLRMEYMTIVRSLCDFITKQCGRPPKDHTRELHSRIVAAYHALQTVFSNHFHDIILSRGKLGTDESTQSLIDRLLEVIELGISGRTSKVASHNGFDDKTAAYMGSIPSGVESTSTFYGQDQNNLDKPSEIYKGDKELKPVSMRVLEAAESLLNAFMNSFQQNSSNYYSIDETAVLKYLSSGNVNINSVSSVSSTSSNSSSIITSIRPQEASRQFKYLVNECGTIFAFYHPPNNISINSGQNPMPSNAKPYSTMMIIRSPFGKFVWQCEFKRLPCNKSLRAQYKSIYERDVPRPRAVLHPSSSFARHSVSSLSSTSSTGTIAGDSSPRNSTHHNNRHPHAAGLSGSSARTKLIPDIVDKLELDTMDTIVPSPSRVIDELRAPLDKMLSEMNWQDQMLSSALGKMSPSFQPKGATNPPVCTPPIPAPPSRFDTSRILARCLGLISLPAKQASENSEIHSPPPPPPVPLGRSESKSTLSTAAVSGGSSPSLLSKMTSKSGSSPLQAHARKLNLGILGQSHSTIHEPPSAPPPPSHTPTPSVTSSNTLGSNSQPSQVSQQKVTLLNSDNDEFISIVKELDMISNTTSDTVFIYYVRRGLANNVQDILDSVSCPRRLCPDFINLLSSLGKVVSAKKHAGWTGHISTSWKSYPDGRTREEPIEEMPVEECVPALFNGLDYTLYWSDPAHEIAFLCPSERVMPSFGSPPAFSRPMGQGSVSGGDTESVSSMEASNDGNQTGPDSNLSGGHKETSTNPRPIPRRPLRRRQLPLFSNIGCDCRVLVVWLESADDEPNLPIEDLLATANCGYIPGGPGTQAQPPVSANIQTPSTPGSMPPPPISFQQPTSSQDTPARDHLFIILHQLENKLIKIKLKFQSAKNITALPLTDGMLVNRNILGQLIRQTALNTFLRKRRFDGSTYQPPHIKRRVQIEEIVEKFGAPSGEANLLAAFLF